MVHVYFQINIGEVTRHNSRCEILRAKVRMTAHTCSECARLYNVAQHLAYLRQQGKIRIMFLFLSSRVLRDQSSRQTRIVTLANTYYARCRKWYCINPTLQYAVSSGMMCTILNADTLTLRLETATCNGGAGVMGCCGRLMMRLYSANAANAGSLLQPYAHGGDSVWCRHPEPFDG